MVLIFYPFTQICIIGHKGTIFSQNKNSVSECIFISYKNVALKSFYHRYPICGPPPPPFFIFFFNSSLLWDVFIINSVEQPKTQSEIDISPFLKTQNPPLLYYIKGKQLWSSES